MPEYLFVFAHVQLNFRLQELHAVSTLLSIPVTYDEALAAKLDTPYMFVNVSSEAACRELAARMVLLRMIVDVWGHGKDETECYKAVQNCNRDKIDPFCGPGSTFKWNVEAFGKHYSRKEKVVWMEKYDGLTVPESCDLDNPDVHLWIMNDIGQQPEHVETDPPRYCYLGRQVATGRREFESKISLKQRNYLGTTSTDALLTLLFANQALVSPGKLVWDPCCGTASILVGCAAMGALCFGSDVDYKIVRGKDEDPKANIAANFAQYNMENHLLGVSMMDLCHPAIRNGLRFDAIVTDPPYGVREGSRKVHKNEESEVSRDFRDRGMHATQMEKPSIGIVLSGLLDLAAHCLTMHGRLVFLFPCVPTKSPIKLPTEYSDEILPRHPCLRLVANSEEILGSRWSRRLLTMEKIREPSDSDTTLVSQEYDVRTLFHPTQKRKKRESSTE